MRSTSGTVSTWTGLLLGRVPLMQRCPLPREGLPGASDVGIFVGATPKSERFAAWLAAAMRHANLEIDGQLGGGRAELASKVGVSRSTVTRWLSGQTLPAPEQFDALSAALNVYVINMLVDSGIVSRERAAPPSEAPAGIYDFGEEIPERIDTAKLAARLGYAAEEQDIFVAVVETTMASLRERRIRALAQEGYEGTHSGGPSAE